MENVYVNQVYLTFTPYDLALDFGLCGASQDDRKPVVCVRMSPQHALAMSRVLVKELEEYQKQVGHISFPIESETGKEGTDDERKA